MIGPLLSAPPARGELQAALRALAAKTWKHPVTGRYVQFSVPAIERWYYTARRDSLWHLDFHHGSRKVLTPRGRWETPIALGVLDDCSRLGCHLPWYLSETAEDLAHGFCQACQKRGLPRAAMSDGGAAMIAAEVTEGLARLGIVHEKTLPYSPYQNGKQEVFWATLEGRLIQMLDGVKEFRHEDLVPWGTRIRTRLQTESASRDELLELLNHALAKAGNPSLMTGELRDTLVDHAAGNYRLLMTLGGELLAHGLAEESAQLDEKCFLEVYQPSRSRPLSGKKGRSLPNARKPGWAWIWP